MGLSWLQLPSSPLLLLRLLLLLIIGRIDRPDSSIVADAKPHVEFDVRPRLFELNRPHIATCTIFRYEAIGQSFQVDFYVRRNNLRNANRFRLGSLSSDFERRDDSIYPEVIGTFLVINKYTTWRPAISGDLARHLAVEPGYSSFPRFELQLTPRSNESRAIYGCYFQPDISISANAVRYFSSGTWNALTSAALSPSSSSSKFVYTLFVIYFFVIILLFSC